MKACCILQHRFRDGYLRAEGLLLGRNRGQTRDSGHPSGLLSGVLWTRCAVENRLNRPQVRPSRIASGDQSLQPCVLGLSLLQDGNLGVRVFPEREASL
jgi:hypothetical protein